MNHFLKLSFDDLSQERIQNLAMDALENTSTLALTFKWTPNSKVVFYLLHCRVKDGHWFDVLKGSSVSDYDGNQTFYLGNHSSVTEIEVRFGVFAVTAVPKAVAIIAQDNPTRAGVVSPKGTATPKQIAQGGKWEDTFKYTIYGNAIS